MKRIILFLIALFLSASGFAEENDILTADGLEKELGINTSIADAESLKVILDAIDDAFIPYYEIRERCLTRLIELGQEEWVVEYHDSAKIPLHFDGMTYEEIKEMDDFVNLAMWLSSTWQEVTVPQGVWKVGEDIPAGHWTVKCAPGASYSNIDWGERVSESGDSISWSGRYSVYNKIYNPSKYGNADEYVYEYSFEVVNGDYIVIGDGSAVFMPYVGKPSLGFK